MAYVYIATNKINNNQYIGITKTSLERRIYMHFWNATSSSKWANKTVFGKAIIKYGKDAFAFTILEEHASYRDAQLAEVRLIAQHRPAYNVAAGGIGPMNVKWTADRRQKTVPKLKAAWTKERKESMRLLFKGTKKSPETIAKIKAARPPKQFFKPVVCLEDGILFESMKSAASYYGISKKSLSEAMCGRQQGAGGLHFAFAEKPMTYEDRMSKLQEIAGYTATWRERNRQSRCRPVLSILDGKSFESCRSAAHHYGLSYMTISNCCQKGLKTKNGLSFSYIDGNHS